MAISKSFFGLRKGSTKDHTFATYRGQQVTKSRVSKVANPQSDQQMMQRLKLVTVANAATKLKGLVNHSFEGVAYGQSSVSKFRAVNLVTDAVTVNSYVPKGYGDCGVADYIVSKGSLPEITVAWHQGQTTSADVSLFRVPAAPENKGVVKAWMKMNNLKENDQLTFLAGFRTGSILNSNGLDVYAHSFAIARLELKFDEEGELILSKDGINEGWSFRPRSGEDYTTGSILQKDGSFFFVMAAASGDLAAKTELFFAGAGFSDKEGYGLDMMAVIQSRLENGVWRRSFSRFGVNVYDRDCWISFENAYPSYVKAASSSKYLNMGNQPTGIIGDQ